MIGRFAMRRSEFFADFVSKYAVAYPSKFKSGLRTYLLAAGITIIGLVFTAEPHS